MGKKKLNKQVNTCMWACFTQINDNCSILDGVSFSCRILFIHSDFVIQNLKGNFVFLFKTLFLRKNWKICLNLTTFRNSLCRFFTIFRMKSALKMLHVIILWAALNLNDTSKLIPACSSIELRPNKAIFPLAYFQKWKICAEELKLIPIGTHFSKHEFYCNKKCVQAVPGKILRFEKFRDIFKHTDLDRFLAVLSWICGRKKCRRRKE